MKKPYTAPDLEMRKILSFETVSTSGGDMTDDDNDLNASEAWGDDW